MNKGENYVKTKRNIDLEYKNKNYNYSVSPNDIKFKIVDKGNDILIQQITLKNTGKKPWKSGSVFKCLPDSQIKGKDYKIECKVDEDATINIDIIFDDFKENLSSSVNEYITYYQMFNSNNEAFGTITKFRVIFQN